MLGNLIDAGHIVNVNEFQEAYPKILLWFFSYPEKEFALGEIAEQLSISKATASILVSKLAKEGFLKKEVIGKVWRISCNQQHRYNYTKKIAYTLLHIHSSEIIDKIKKEIASSRAIILFGSYRKGDDNENSDIDIAIEILGNEDLKVRNIGTIKKFGYRTNVTVNIHVFSRNRIDLNFFSNIANGIVLDGFLEVRP
jgi:predicted nucleotidyltransferase